MLREQLLDHVWAVVNERPRREHDLKVRIPGQHCLKQILLLPMALPLEEVARILVRQEYVVNVNQHTRRERREDVENHPVDVAADLDRVRRVNEDDVPSLDALEDI